MNIKQIARAMAQLEPNELAALEELVDQLRLVKTYELKAEQATLKVRDKLDEIDPPEPEEPAP